MTLKWRGTPIDNLDNDELLEALSKTIQILGALWDEVARRRLVFRT